MKFNGTEFAKQMREGKCVDLHGNVVCTLELWERIASIIEDQSDGVDRLLNLMLKIDNKQAEKLRDLQAKLEETYLSAEGLKMENVKLKEENKQLRAKRRYFIKDDGRLVRIPDLTDSEIITKVMHKLIDKYHEAIEQIAKEIIDEN